MNLREADEVARRGLPVMHNGLEYKRITRTGYIYDGKGGRIGFVELYDKNGKTVVYAEPAAVTLKGGDSSWMK